MMEGGDCTMGADRLGICILVVLANRRHRV